MGASGLLGVDSADHLGVVFEGLLGLVGALGGEGSTWLPVMPWQMTLVCLFTQTLGVVLNMRVKTLLSMDL